MKKLFFMAAIALSMLAVANSSETRNAVPSVTQDGYALSDTVPGKQRRDSSRTPRPDSSRRLPTDSLNQK